MADNITLKDKDGNAFVVRADDISSVFWQYLKLAFGTDGTATVVDAANPLPVLGAAVQTTDSWGGGADDGDQLPLICDDSQRLWVVTAESGYSLSHVKTALVISQTGAALITPASGAYFKLRKLIVRCTAAGLVKFFADTDAANTAIGPDLDMAIGETFEMQWDMDLAYTAQANQVLKYTSDGDFTGSFYAEWFEVT
jgi:hypothetical protein